MIDKGVKKYIIEKVISIADEHKLSVKFREDTDIEGIVSMSIYYVMNFKLTSTLLPYEEFTSRIKKINKKIGIPKLVIVNHMEREFFILSIELKNMPKVERYIKLKILNDE